MDERIETASPGLAARAKAMVLKPRDEWPKIAVETRSQSEILTHYVLPLAAITPLAILIGSQLFDYGPIAFSERPGLITLLFEALLRFILSVALLYLLAYIASLIAPKFGGESDRARAYRLVAYASTAAWLSGLFAVIPSLGFFRLLGLYSVFILYTGAVPMLGISREKAGPFTAILAGSAVLLLIVTAQLIAASASALTGAAAGFAAPASRSAPAK